jgi:GxxExxY protein
MTENQITEIVIGCAITVHSALGPGLLESAYEACLMHELGLKEIQFTGQKALPLIYKDVKLECGYRADFLVENKVIVEVKSVDALHDIHLAQVITYLKLSNCSIGLLLNFNVLKMKDGIKRVANKYNQTE